jgi:hypothetical protein
MKKLLGIAVCLIVFAFGIVAMRPATPPVRVDASTFQMYHPTVYVVHLTIYPSNLVARPPSLSAAFINRVLAAEQSPAAGSGEAFYQFSVQYQIDDAFTLAVFEHESAFGKTGIASLTHSIGNIRCSAGYPCVYGFRWYPTWAAGLRDYDRLLRTLYVNQWHLLTVEQIIPVASPAADSNDPSDYIHDVQASMSAWRTEETQR